VIDETYEAFAPFWAMSLAVKPEAIQTQFGYTDEKDFPQVKNANPRDFFDTPSLIVLRSQASSRKLDSSDSGKLDSQQDRRQTPGIRNGPRAAFYRVLELPLSTQRLCAMFGICTCS